MDTIKIGHNSENDIVLTDKSVSGFHIEASYNYKDHSCIIQDMDSTNGTYVNNRRINKKRIDSKDQLIIGSVSMDTPIFLAQIKEINFARKSDFSDQYTDIIKQLDQYVSAKNKLLKTPLLPNIIRIAMSVLLVIVLLFFPDFIPNPNLRYVLIVVIGLIPMIVGMISSNKNKNRDKLDLLTLQYEENVKCPKCHSILLKYTSLYLKQKGKCPHPKCNASFSVL